MLQHAVITRSSAIADGSCNTLYQVNLVNCCTAVGKITFEKTCNTWMTLKVTQGCRYLIRRISIPIGGL